MICFVDLEHEKVSRDPRLKPGWLARRLDVKFKLEEISGDACLLQRYTSVTPARLKEWRIRALILSGCSTDWGEYDPASLEPIQEIIRAAELPILGFCGGHQMIAMAHGAPVGAMRRLRAEEADPPGSFAPGYLIERGFMPVRVLRDDPIFAGLGPTPIFLESHYWEVKALPAGFVNLASTDDCAIQVLRRVDRPVYGTQFHPEGYSLKPYDALSLSAMMHDPTGYPEARPDGRRLIENFFRIAGVRS
jgi:GMP synthase (glutamine-hydrolysing)